MFPQFDLRQLAFFAAVVVSALSDQSLEFAIPWGQLVLLVGLTLVMALVVMSVNTVSDIANAAVRRQP